MITPPLFDCNVWTGSNEAYPTGGIDTPDALLDEMDRVGIDRALVYHIEARAGNAKDGNDRLMEAIADSPRLEPSWVVGPSAVADYGSEADLVGAMTEAGVRSVRLFPGEADYRLVDDEVKPLLAALADANVLAILDTVTGLEKGFTYEELGEVCAHHGNPAFDRPELSVVLTQTKPSLGSLSRFDDLIETIENVGNLYLSPDRFQAHEGIRQLVDRVGVDRLLFGTRLPHASAGAGIAAIVQSSLTTDEQRRVAGENLSRLLGETGAGWETAGRAPVRALKTVPYEIIDIHGHVRDDGPPDELTPDAEGIVEGMDRTGIALCCVSKTNGTPEGNNVVAHAARRYPDRLVPFASANPNKPYVREELERCFDELGMRMIKIHPASHDTTPDDPSYDPVWEFAEARECLIVTHGLCHDEERDAWIERAQAHPDATLMLYHAARAWDRADNFIEVAETCSNVLLEITFSYNVDGIIEYLIEHVGAERVFFGTDLGARAPASQVGWATYARIGEDERRLHMRENALQLLDEMDALPAAYRDEI